MGAEICFDDYLRSLIKKDERSQDGYTQTDVANLVDFGLMVQTIQEQEKRQEGKESQDSEQEKSKIERFPVLDGIRKYAADHVLLVGRPGSGKSTALRKMLVDEAQKVLNGQSSLIPVLIELRSWRTSYIALIKDFFRVHKLRLNEETIDDLLFEGKLLLLVDGVNELPANENARQDIINLRETNPNAPMIFTTRVLGVGGDLGIEKKLEMLPLSEPQMRQFVQMRLLEQSDQMLQQLGDRLRKFGDTPLLLSMLCDVFQKNGRVPANLGAAFRDFANLHDGKLKEDVSGYEHSRSWWAKLLQQLAFTMMPQDRPNGLRLSIPRLEAEEILTRFLDGEKFPKPRHYAHRWLEDLLKYHLIQVKLVGTDQEIEFRHQLIQEYYAAEYLLPLFPNFTDIKLQHSYLNYLDWTEPLALMLELVESEEQAVRVVRLALEVDLRLGARLAGAVKYGFQEKTVGLLIQEIEEREIPKLSVIEILDLTRSDFAINSLIKLVEGDNFLVSRNIAESLGRIASDKAIDALLLILNNQDTYVYTHEVDVLGKMGNKRLINILINRLQDESLIVRSNAAEVLGRIGGKDNIDIDALLLAFNNQDSLRLARLAWILGEIGSDRAVNFLILVLKDQDSYVRRQAAEALGKITSNKAVDALIFTLDDQDSYVRRQAAGALGEIACNTAVDKLIMALNDEDKMVRYHAIEALGRIESDKATDALILAINDADPSIRSSVVWALSQHKRISDKEFNTLIYALKDQDSDVCDDVVDALIRIDIHKAINVLTNIINSEAKDMRSDALWALGVIGSDSSIDIFMDALNDTDDKVRSNATWALGNISSKKAVEPLILILNDQDLYFRVRVAWALGNIGCEKAVDSLILALNDKDYDLRWNAAEALGKIGSNKAIEPLILTLNDQDTDVRISAAWALGIIKSDKAI
ncbi:MAG: HEAT repeat domain-containing protein, partial [Pseudanabaena sp.]